MNGEINLKMFVVGKENANVILSPCKFPKDRDPAYEIGISFVVFRSKFYEIVLYLN